MRIADVEIRAPIEQRFDEVLTTGALDLLAGFTGGSTSVGYSCSTHPPVKQAELDAGGRPAFLPETREVRESTWQVAPPPGRPR